MAAVKIGRRKFLQFGAAAPLAADRLKEALIATVEAQARAPLPGYGAIGGRLRDEIGGETAEAFFDPISDLTRRIGLVKTVPRWHWEQRYGAHFDPRTSDNMKSWSPAFKRIFDHDDLFRQYRVGQVRLLKSRLKQFLWRRAGKDLP
jgi:hypothetical protein